MKKVGNFLLGVLVWFCVGVLLVIIMAFLWPNDTKMTDGLGAFVVALLVIAPIVVAVLVVRVINSLDGRIHLNTLFSFQKEKTDEDIDALSEWEKWKLEKQQIAQQEQTEPTDSSYSPALTYSDEMLPSAVDIVVEIGQASTSAILRRLKLSYWHAARLVDEMERMEIVGPFNGATPRDVLLSKSQWQELKPRLIYGGPALQVDEQAISQDELAWRRGQRGLPSIEFELDKIDHMEGHAFEYWCADLLRKNGFSNVEVTQGSGDQGVDVLAQKDGIKYAVQCKCYSSDLSNKPVQEVNTGRTIYKCQIGVVMTNRYFTKGAKEAASATGVLLWDRDKLIEMIKVSK